VQAQGNGAALRLLPSGITERDAGVASGLLNTSQNLGGAIGVAVASSIAASHFGLIRRHH